MVAMVFTLETPTILFELSLEDWLWIFTVLCLYGLRNHCLSSYSWHVTPFTMMISLNLVRSMLLFFFLFLVKKN